LVVLSDTARMPAPAQIRVAQLPHKGEHIRSRLLFDQWAEIIDHPSEGSSQVREDLTVTPCPIGWVVLKVQVRKKGRRSVNP
jgi:hypothetical protein